MSRRVETGGVAAEASGAPVDDYLGRLVKYIPAEIIGFYLAGAGMISSDPAKPNYPGLWVVFGLGFALVPIYFFIATTRENKPPLWSQVALTTIAYPVWVFALGGPFASLSWYRGELAALLLVFVTVIFGMYKPPLGT